MIKKLFPILLAFLLFGCSSSEKSLGNKQSENKKVLTENDSITFGRIYIDASTQKVLGNYEEALQLYTEAIKIDPSQAAPYYESAIILNGFGKEDAAFEFMQKAIGIEPENYWYNYIYAKLLEEKNHLPEAVEAYKRLVEQNPEKIELKYELAKVHFYNKEFEKSIKVLNDIEKEIGVSEEISILKQKTYLNMNDVDKAADEIRELIKAFPGEYAYYVQLAEIYMSNNREEDAIKVYSELSEMDPNNPRAQLAMADYHKLKGDKAKSYELLKAAMGNKALDIDVKVQYILTNYQVGEKEQEKKAEALELTSIIADAHPQDAKAQALSADFLYFANRLEEAKKAYERTIAIDSSRFPVWNQLMLLLSEMNDMEGLVNYGERGVNLFPNQPSIYLFFGSALSMQNEHLQAIEYLEMGKNLVIDNDPLLSQFYTSLGDSYHQMGDHEKSDSYYEKALELDPNNVYVLNNYSYYLSTRGEKLEKAKKMSEKSNQLAPGQSSYLDTYAWILYKMGDYKEANIWIDKALSGSETSGVILEHKGDILYKLNKVDEAVEYWVKAKNAGDASDLIEKKITDKKLYE